MSYLRVVLVLGVVTVVTAPVVHSQVPKNVSIEILQRNAKLKNANEVLADFYAGKAETGVIVYLKPSAAATAMVAEAKQSAQVPEEFNRPGAPPYYNLEDESVKKALSATVRETVDRTINSLNQAGLTVKQKFMYQFGFAARVTPAALEDIVNNPDVIEVAKDHILHAHLAQGIPLMNATTPRSTYTGGGVSIAICDTGIDTSHPRLGGGGFPNRKVIGGYDTGDNDADPRPNASTGSAHGTACAGIAAGNTGTVDDYIGGVAYGAKLYAIKISTGTSGSATEAAMIAGWEWAVTHKNDDSNNPIMVISTSFGGGRYYSSCDSASSGMTTAAANAVAAGITVFASAGNDGYCDSMGWPACISYVNSVGAVYDANFGTYYPCVDAASCAPKTATGSCSTGWYATDSTSPDKVTSYSNSASFLDIFAPSNRAYTLDIVGAGGYSSGDYDSSFGGTSAACPYAAGAAAVLQSAAKTENGSFLTPSQVSQYLVNYGDNITDSKVAVTKPRVNLGNAVGAIGGGGGLSDFIIDSISLSPLSPAVGDTVTATIVVKNQGDASGTGNWLDIWWDQPTVTSCGAVGDVYDSVPSMAAGATSTFIHTFTATTAGSYVLRAFIDSSCSTTESNETNNQGTLNYTIGEGDLPDFVIDSISLNFPAPEVGDTVTATIVVKNQGDAPGIGNGLDIWWDLPTATSCGAIGDVYDSVPSIAAGATGIYTHSFTATTAGSYVLRAFIDSGCYTTESNETNNQGTLNYTISPPGGASSSTFWPMFLPAMTGRRTPASY